MRMARLADIVVIASGAVGLLVFCYSFYYYGWTRERQFTRLEGPFLYYIAPLILASVCLCSLRLPAPRKIKFALSLSSTVASVLVLETLLTIWLGFRGDAQTDQRMKAAEMSRPLLNLRTE